jgi:predicted phage terminase large subunit-like protein
MEGALAAREWFSFVDALPANCTWVRSWDFAATERSATADDPDYCAGAKLGVYEGVYYLADVIRRRSGPGAVEALVRQTAELDSRDVAIVLEQEPGSSGKLFSAALVRQLAGWNVAAEPASGDKVTRAMPWLAQAQVGNVKLARGAWNAEFLDEVAAFPIGAHDDQVDAVSGAFAKLTGDVPSLFILG